MPDLPLGLLVVTEAEDLADADEECWLFEFITDEYFVVAANIFFWR